MKKFQWLSLILFATVAVAQTNPNFDRPVTDFANVRHAIAVIYEQQSYGNFNSESEFTLHRRTPDGTPLIREIHNGNNRFHEEFYLMAGDTAVFHTHPSSRLPYPSEQDIEVAEKYRLDMYTVSSQGVYLYRTGMTQPELVMTTGQLLALK
jgi:hypothetical protein